MLVAVQGEVVGRTEAGIEVAKPQVFGGIVEKVVGFVIVRKLFIRMKIREEVVKE